MPPAAVEITGLVKRYGGRAVVDGVDLEVAAGETVALLGPNGAGKTTIVECCEGYRRPDGGAVRVLGLDPVADARALRPRVGLMLQEGGIYPAARVAEVVRLFAAFYRAPLDPDALIDRCGLTAVRRTRYRYLSGGEKQRLSLALALVGRPELVFLDEPTAGLDPAARRATLELIAGLCRGGVTVVLATHLLDEAETVADRVVIVDHGQIVAAGTPYELARTGLEQVTFTSVRGLDTVALGSSIGVAVRETTPGAYVITAAATPQLVAALTAWLAANGHGLGRLDAGTQRLEEVYLELTEPDRR